MSEAMVRCPQCGFDGIVITELLDRNMELIADHQEAEIERLRQEVNRLHTECGHLQADKNEIERLLAKMLAIVDHGLPVYFTQWEETLNEVRRAVGGPGD